jgi:DNA-binding CsgD family transcriptional regulator
MLSMIEKRIAYQKAEEVAEICRPLFSTFQLNYFVYSRMYHNSSKLALLVSDKRFYKHYHEKEFSLIETLATPGVHLWSDYMPRQAVADGANYFNHHNGIFILKQHAEFTEKIEIAAPANKTHPIELYCNHMDIINNFIFYFKDKATNLIDCANSNKFTPPKTMIAEERPTIHAYKNFLNLIKTQKIKFSFQNKEVAFTRREYDCLLLLSQGKTMKEIAEILNISPRTIETFLLHAKTKTSCRYKSQLIDFFHNNVAFRS